MRPCWNLLTRSCLALLCALLVPSPVLAQEEGQGPVRGLVSREELFQARMRLWGIDHPDPAPRRPTGPADRRAWERAKRAAEAAPGRKVVISLFERRLFLVEGRDTLLSTEVGIGMGRVSIRGQSFDFSTPRGRRVVRAKERDPVWTPPDWHYTTAALADGRAVRHLSRRRPVELADGRLLVVRDTLIGTVDGAGHFEPHPPEQAIVHDNVLYIPPVGTPHRRIPGVLGRYKLDLGGGILIHGTTDGLSFGFPSTHGCIRVDAAPLEALYQQVKVGTPVFLY